LAASNCSKKKCGAAVPMQTAEPVRFSFYGKQAEEEDQQARLREREQQKRDAEEEEKRRAEEEEEEEEEERASQKKKKKQGMKKKKRIVPMTDSEKMEGEEEEEEGSRGREVQRGSGGGAREAPQRRKPREESVEIDINKVYPLEDEANWKSRWISVELPNAPASKFTAHERADAAHTAAVIARDGGGRKRRMGKSALEKCSGSVNAGIAASLQRGTGRRKRGKI
jgi:hypothetical protein